MRDSEADDIILKRNHAWDSKLIVTKVLVRDLETLKFNALNSAFSEFKHFYKFDQICYKTTKKLALVKLFKLGKKLQK